MAGYGMKGLFVAQDIQQFEDVYGERAQPLGQYRHQDFPCARQ